MRSPTSHSSPAAAFSLIEVLVSIGIAAVAIITLLGLLPTGLSSIQRAAGDAAEARALQAVVADFQMRDWPSILRQQESQITELMYFDTHGFRVPQYDASAFLLAAVNVAHAPPLPGATTTNTRLRLLRMRTSRNTRAGASALEDKQSLRETQALLVQMDKSP